MARFLKKPTIILLTALVVIAIILLATANFLKEKRPPPEQTSKPDVLTPVHRVIGRSVEGRPIDAYTYNASTGADSAGQKHVLFVGGIHGGYEWNSALLAYELLDYLAKNSAGLIPPNVSVTVIPSANPDGVYKVTGKDGRFALSDVPSGEQFEELKAEARFNVRGVDINRNFDCKWAPQSTWRSKVVSAGIEPFSEPETAAIRDFILSQRTSPVSAVLFWHSQANAVYASECEQGILPVTLDIMNAYASASGYQPIKAFDSYSITGDAEGWLASIGVPAVTVELQTHESTEWERNLAGIKAILKYFERKI